MTQIIYIIGMPGIGKSYYTSLVSDKLSIDWIDLDKYIEDVVGSPIRELIQDKGEEFFRLHEANCLRQLLAKDGRYLVATGGGTPCFCDNMKYMQSNGTTIYLHANAEYLVKQYHTYNLTRPLAEGQDIDTYLIETYKTRHPQYSLADYTIDMNNPEAENLEHLCNIINAL